MKTLNILTFVVALLAWTSQTRAEPDGNGHYMPTVDVSAGDSSLFTTNILLNYDDATYNADYGLSLTNSVQNPNNVVYEDSIMGFHAPKPEDGGGYYIVATDIPYSWADGKATIPPPSSPSSRNRSDYNLGLGYVEFWPLLPGRVQNDFSYDVRLAIYSPNDQYAARQQDNAGTGYAAFEPQVAFGWLNPKIGMEVSIFSGLAFNKENTTIDYESGDFFHVDTTVAKHLPFLGGIAGMGVNGFYVRQVASDNASGSQVGSIRKRSAGGGPLIFYVHDIGKKQFIFEAKWLPKVNVIKLTMVSLVRVELTLNF